MSNTNNALYIPTILMINNSWFNHYNYDSIRNNDRI